MSFEGHGRRQGKGSSIEPFLATMAALSGHDTFQEAILDASNHANEIFLEDEEVLVFRYRELALTALGRFTKEREEVYAGKPAVNVSPDGELVLQLEQPVIGGAAERWEIRINPEDQYGELKQLYYSQAGKSWMEGASIIFGTGKFASETPYAGILCEKLVSKGEFYNGLRQAINEWPVAKWAVSAV